VVALGSNLPGAFGSSEALLEAVVEALREAGLRVIAVSQPWSSAAWPDPGDPPFVNRVALVETDSQAESVMGELLRIERAFGRDRTARNAPRTLDLDLIDHDGELLDALDLVLPHPRAHERRFVMGPLAEIAPAWCHPVLGATAEELAATAMVGRDAEPLRRVAT
jgi:2-amino-4-hydroxy-6-hydroxymethyldihydropteridine diphosphokinase